MKLEVLIYRPYKEYFKLYTEIQGLIAVNSFQVNLFENDKIVPEDDDILINYSKSASNVFRLIDYIQFTFYSFCIFYLKLKKQFYDKSKTGNHLKSTTYNLSHKETMHSLHTICFSLRLVYLTSIFKKFTYKSHLFFLAHAKHVLIHHLNRRYCHDTVNKSIGLKMWSMSSYRAF